MSFIIEKDKKDNKKFENMKKRFLIFTIQDVNVPKDHSYFKIIQSQFLLGIFFDVIQV